MRSRALAALSLAMASAGILRAAVGASVPASTLSCESVVSIVEPAGPRLACADDAALAGCGSVRPGLAYRGCEAVGTVPGALLVARGLPIDVRFASEADLRALPGVGPSLARRIVERRSLAPLCGLDDLEALPGLGPKRVGSWLGLLAFDDPRCEPRR